MENVRYKYIIIHLIICILSLIIVKGLQQQMNYMFMYIFSVWSIYVYIRLLWIEIKNTSGLTLMTFYLIGCLIRVGIGGYDSAVKGLHGINVYYILNNVSDYMFETSIWMNISYMLFITFFIFFTKKINTNIELSGYIRKYNTFAIAIALYVLSYLIKLFSGVSFSDTLSSIFSELSKVSLLLLTFTCVYKYNKAQFTVFILLIVIDSLTAIFTGFYKGNIILPFIFLILYYYLKNKHTGKFIFSPNLIGSGLFLFAFLLLFVYPFMNEKRERSGFDPYIGNATKEYSNMEIIDDLFAGKIKYANEDNTSEQFINRMSAITTNAFFYKHANIFSDYIYYFIKNTILLSVPKVIYPDKPTNDIGLMATSLANSGTLNPINETSYTYIGFFSSSYMIGGIAAVIVMCLLNGLIYAKVYGFVLNNILNPFALLLLLKILLEAFSAYEETMTGGIGSWISYLIILLLIVVTNFIFTNIKIKK